MTSDSEVRDALDAFASVDDYRRSEIARRKTLELSFLASAVALLAATAAAAGPSFVEWAVLILGVLVAASGIEPQVVLWARIQLDRAPLLGRPVVWAIAALVTAAAVAITKIFVIFEHGPPQGPDWPPWDPGAAPILAPLPAPLVLLVAAVAVAAFVAFALRHRSVWTTAAAGVSVVASAALAYGHATGSALASVVGVAAFFALATTTVALFRWASPPKAPVATRLKHAWVTRVRSHWEVGVFGVGLGGLALLWTMDDLAIVSGAYGAFAFVGALAFVGLCATHLVLKSWLEARGVDLGLDAPTLRERFRSEPIVVAIQGVAWGLAIGMFLIGHPVVALALILFAGVFPSVFRSRRSVGWTAAVVLAAILANAGHPSVLVQAAAGSVAIATGAVVLYVAAREAVGRVSAA